MYDYQAMCKPLNHHHSAAWPLVNVSATPQSSRPLLQGSPLKEVPMALFWPQGPPRDSDQHTLHSFLPGSLPSAHSVGLSASSLGWLAEYQDHWQRK